MKNQSDLISIIVPVYKAEMYLKRCISSIQAQTYKNFEILLIDDDSPDECPRLCDEFAEKHENIISIHLKGTAFGASDARNAGLDRAKGKYIAFIDSDDYVHPNLLEELILAFNIRSDVALTMCSYTHVFDSHGKENLSQGERAVLLTGEDAMALLIADQTFSAVWGKLFRSDLFEDLRFPVGRHNEDMFVMLKIIEKAKQSVYLNRQLYYYFQDSESLCRSSFNYRMLDMVEALEEWRRFVNQHYPKIKGKADARYFITLIDMCQYLASKKDCYGVEKYRSYVNEIKRNFAFILKSPDISTKNKIKTVLARLGQFGNVINLMVFLHMQKFD